MAELIVKIQVRCRPLRHGCATVPKGTPIRHESVVPCVAQHIAAIELVEMESARAARQPHRAGMEKLFQLPDDAENSDLFVLINVIEIADRDDPLRSNLIV